MTPLIVACVEPFEIVPVVVPPSVPVPAIRASETPVACVAGAGLLFASWTWTMTEKPVPAVGLVPPLTEVMASFVGVPLMMTAEAGLAAAVSVLVLTEKVLAA